MLKQNKYTKSVLNLILLAFCFLGIIKLQTPSLNQETKIDLDYLERQQRIKQSELNLFARTPYFGFNNLVSDWLFLNFIGYYGDAEAREINGYNLLVDYYELIVKTDPRFVQAYFNLDPATTYFAGRPDKSVAFMNYGLQYIEPNQLLAYQIWLFKATNELLFLGNTPEAKKSFQMAAKWVKIENTENSASFSQIFKTTAKYLEDNPDSRNARLSSWLMVLDRARDETVKQFALQKLEELGAQIIVEGNSLSVKMPPEDE